MRIFTHSLPSLTLLLAPSFAYAQTPPQQAAPPVVNTPPSTTPEAGADGSQGAVAPTPPLDGEAAAPIGDEAAAPIDGEAAAPNVELVREPKVSEVTTTTVVPALAAPAPRVEATVPPPVAPTEANDDSQALDPTLKAHFGKGVTIGTADETFTLNIRARMQVQAAYYEADDETEADLTQLQVRRARVVFQGNALGPELTYYLQLAFSNRDSEPDVRLPLRDAYFTYAPHTSVNLRIGQMKVPYGRQRVVSSSAQGMVDRSVVVTELNLDRDVGVQVFSKDVLGTNGKLGYALGVFGGDGRNRVATNAGYLYVGRLVLTPFGSFDEASEADIEREDRPRLSLAATAVRNQATNRPQSTLGSPYSDPDVFFDYTHFGADLMFKYKGFFATGEWMYRKADDSIQSGQDEMGEVTDFYSRDAWGAYGQLGQMLTDKLEVSARYGHINPLADTDPELSLKHELGGGLSYYFDEHNLKVQADYFYYAKNNELKHGDHQVRVQSQLYF